MLYPLYQHQEVGLDACPFSNCSDEVFPNFDVGLRPNQQSFKLREKLVDMFDDEWTVELIDFEVFSTLTFFFHQHLIVDNVEQSSCKALGVGLLPKENHNISTVVPIFWFSDFQIPEQFHPLSELFRVGMLDIGKVELPVPDYEIR